MRVTKAMQVWICTGQLVNHKAKYIYIYDVAPYTHALWNIYGILCTLSLVKLGRLFLCYWLGLCACMCMIALMRCHEDSLTFCTLVLVGTFYRNSNDTISSQKEELQHSYRIVKEAILV